MPLGKEWKPERCRESPPCSPDPAPGGCAFQGAQGTPCSQGNLPLCSPPALVPHQAARRAPCFPLQPQPRGQERSGPRRQVRVRPHRRQLTSSLRCRRLLSAHMATSGKVRTLAALLPTPSPRRSSPAASLPLLAGHPVQSCCCLGSGQTALSRGGGGGTPKGA